MATTLSNEALTVSNSSLPAEARPVILPDSVRLRLDASEAASTDVSISITRLRLSATAALRASSAFRCNALDNAIRS
ncbi:hypothetical protein D3C81_2246590 [compost metagenome]